VLRAFVALMCLAVLSARAEDSHPRTLVLPLHTGAPAVRPASSGAAIARAQASAGAASARAQAAIAGALVRRAAGGAATPGVLPTWSSSVSVGGQLYQPIYVGTDPQQGSQTSVVTVNVVPVRIVLNDGTVFDPTWPRLRGRRAFGQSALQATLASPIFQPANFTLGGVAYGAGVQYGDALMRASWWSTVSSAAPAWHVKLQYAVQPVLTLNAYDGNGVYGALSTAHRRLALVDLNWFGNQVDAIIQSADPSTLLLFLMDQVELCGDGTTCGPGQGFLGLHGAQGNGSGGTAYVFASYFDAGSWDWVNDVSVISHEVAEFLNNPYGGNNAPLWPFGQIGSQPVCLDELEVGDPIENLHGTVWAPSATFSVPTLWKAYSMQNEALVPWFLPPAAYSGPYTLAPLSPAPVPAQFTTAATCQ